MRSRAGERLLWHSSSAVCFVIRLEICRKNRATHEKTNPMLRDFMFRVGDLWGQVNDPKITNFIFWRLSLFKSALAARLKNGMFLDIRGIQFHTIRALTGHWLGGGGRAYNALVLANFLNNLKQGHISTRNSHYLIHNQCGILIQKFSKIRREVFEKMVL